MDATFLMQSHKETLVTEACQYITYLNRGIEEPECTELLKNPNLDVGKLISYDYKKDMCTCSTCQQFVKTLTIPAAVYEHKGNSYL